MIQTNYSLKEHSTLKVGGNAEYYTKVADKKDLLEAIDFAKQNNLKITVLGSISNVIIAEEGIKGLVINFVNNDNIELLENNKVKAQAGVIWDKFVAFCVDKGLCGVENLSLIPGTVGASAVQNIGAYGQEVADTISELEVFDLAENKFTILTNKDCEFAYRKSIFNTSQAGRYIIVNITYQLNTNNVFSLKYKDLEPFRNSKNITLETLRQEIIRIRTNKLPDYTKIPNVGSFFKNIVINKSEVEEIYNKAKLLNAEKAEAIKGFKVEGDFVKLPTALLIEICGLKGYKQEHIGIYDKHALIVVHHSKNGNTQDVINFANFITQELKSKLGVEIEQEPTIIS